MNPLARSRLKAAQKWFDSEIVGIKPKERDQHIETIRAAIDALLNPKVTDDILYVGVHHWNDQALKNANNREKMYTAYTAMIAKLTREETDETR